MVRIDFKDMLKAVKMLEKESTGGPVTFREDGASLKMATTDRTGREMVIELSDMNYPMLPRITKTETF